MKKFDEKEELAGKVFYGFISQTRESENPVHGLFADINCCVSWTLARCLNYIK